MHLYQSPKAIGSKDIVKVKVYQNLVKVQDQGHLSKVLIQNERPFHEVSIITMSESYHLWFKVKVFCFRCDADTWHGHDNSSSDSPPSELIKQFAFTVCRV
jgi:hypothetical protein